jgi:hypothetical protein
MSWLPSFSLPYIYGTPIVENSTLKTDCIQNACVSSLDMKYCGLEALACFKNSWEIPDFWKRANTCDACVVLLDTLFTQNPNDQQVGEMCKEFQVILEKNLECFCGENLNNKWSDDFGWWGLLGVNAYQFLMKQGNRELADKYLNLACTCYERMVDTGCDHDKTVLPVPFGCRNAMEDSPNIGVKNTVVNGLLLLLSTKLCTVQFHNSLNVPDGFLVTAYNQWIWFSEWFELNQCNYLKHFKNDNEAALVCERPLDFRDGSSYKDMSHPDWAPNWVWSGDNGLLIGAFLNLIALKDKLAKFADQQRPDWKFNENAFSSKIQDITKKLIRGVQKGIIGQDGIFYEPPCPSSYVTNANDYFGGRGILVRYMDLLKIEEFSGIDLKENVEKTVEALWSTRDVVSGQFKAEFTNLEDRKAYAKQFNLLWGDTGQVITWDLDSNPKIKDPICQAVGLDFIAATLRFY